MYIVSRCNTVNKVYVFHSTNYRSFSLPFYVSPFYRFIQGHNIQYTVEHVLDGERVVILVVREKRSFLALQRTLLVFLVLIQYSEKYVILSRSGADAGKRGRERGREIDNSALYRHTLHTTFFHSFTHGDFCFLPFHLLRLHVLSSPVEAVRPNEIVILISTVLVLFFSKGLLCCL